MTIRFSEGFESVVQNQDLFSRGLTNNTSNYATFTDAWYPDGRALGRLNTTANWLIDKNIGAIGNGGGLAISAMVQLSSTNGFTESVSAIRKIRYLGNNTWGAPSGLSSGIKLTNDPLKWPIEVQRITSGNLLVHDLAYDVMRNSYVAVAASNATNPSFSIYTSDSLESTTWSAQALGVANYLGSNKFWYDEDTGTMFYLNGIRLYSRTASDSTFVLRVTASSAFTDIVKLTSGTILAFTGTTTLYRSSDGLEFTNSVVVGSNAVSAATNGTIVVCADSTSIKYSIDGGLSFSTAGLPSNVEGGLLLGYVNGSFVALPRSASYNIAFQSQNGEAWTSSIFSNLGFTTPHALTVEQGRLFGVFTHTYPFTSDDGITFKFGITSYISNSTLQTFVGLQAASGDNYGFSLDANGNWFYYNGTNRIALNLPIVRDQYHNIECSIYENSETSYSINWTLNNGEVVVDAEMTRSLFEAAPPNSFNNTQHPSAFKGAASNSVVIIPCPTNGAVSSSPNAQNYYSLDRGMTWTYLGQLGNIGAVTRVFWTGTRFLIFSGTAFVSHSTSGFDNWTNVDRSSALSSTIDDVAKNEATGTIIAIGANGLMRSTDDGLSWQGQTLDTSSVSGIGCLNGTWVIFRSTGSRYSLDDGLTWSTEDTSKTISVRNAEKAFNALYAISGTTSAYRVTVDTPNSAPTFGTVTLPEANHTMMASTDEYLFVTSSTTTKCYSSDGISFFSFTGIANPACINIDSSFLNYGSGNRSNTRILYPDFADMPFSFKFGNNSFSSIDDIVITDFKNPNAGPQGICRIVRLPSDVDVQAQWEKYPSSAATNAEAAGQVPASLSRSYIEGVNPGDQDVYAASNVNHPSGYRPIAVSIEGNFKRLFSSTPVVKIGVDSNGSVEETPEIPVTVGPNDTVFIQKTIERDPDGNKAWTSASIDTLHRTVTKVE